MHKITPHLWFDKEAKEAARFYTQAFENSRIKSISVLPDTPSGDVDIVTIDLASQEFILLSAGPLFKINTSVSFLVACKTPKEVDVLWATLSPGGRALMELGAYPFSERYGWITDKYGLSWQIMAMGEWPIRDKIIPTLMFSGDACGKAEEAINFYASIFQDSHIGEATRYTKGEGPDKEGTIKHVSFTLAGQEFAAMDSARVHDCPFNEAISLIVNCEDQKEIDYYWTKLSAHPKAEQCGWIKDKYGLSWQIDAIELREMLNTKDASQMKRLMEAMLKMKKLDVAELKRAFNG
jgi:predicted 3-demethylubiquinone-9 3-methyltransferase (glyoxalase superfamily)